MKNTFKYLFAKGIIESCSNYFGVKLIATCWDFRGVIVERLRKEIHINKSIRLYVGVSNMKTIYLLRRLVADYRQGKRDLCMILINLEKVSDMALWEIIWWVLEKKQGLSRYINVLKDMYD